MFLKFRAGLMAVVLLSGLPSALNAGSESIVVEKPWSRVSIGTKRPGAAYMDLRNTGDETVTLIGIRADIAMMSEIHRSSTNDRGVSSMTPAGDIPIAPGGTVSLKPGGLHAMLMELKKPMIEDEAFSLTLVFSDGSEVSVEVPILSIAARGPEG